MKNEIPTREYAHATNMVSGHNGEFTALRAGVWVQFNLSLFVMLSGVKYLFMML